jgi:hypothetical protein
MALGGLSAYVLFSAAITFRCIRKTGAAIHEGNSAGVESIFVTMRRRSTRLQELIKTAVYLFGIVLFFSFQCAYVVIDHLKT